MNRDRELDLLLAKLRAARVSEGQMAKWQSAVARELAVAPQVKASRFRWPAQMAAILATGFILGFLVSRQVPSAGENPEPSATVQYIYSKSE